MIPGRPDVAPRGYKLIKGVIEIQESEAKDYLRYSNIHSAWIKIGRTKFPLITRGMVVVKRTGDIPATKSQANDVAV